MARRGGDCRGSAKNRRARHEWLVETFRADRDAAVVIEADGSKTVVQGLWLPHGEGAPACRCFRCGDLLIVETVTADRIKPGAEGGSYRRDNIRPACAHCNSKTGGHLGAARKRAAA